MAQQDLRTGRIRPGQTRMAVHQLAGFRFRWDQGDDWNLPQDERLNLRIGRHRDQLLQEQIHSIGWRHRHRHHAMYTEDQRNLAIRYRRRYQMPYRAIARRIAAMVAGGGYGQGVPQPSPATIRRWVMESPNEDVENLQP